MSNSNPFNFKEDPDDYAYEKYEAPSSSGSNLSNKIPLTSDVGFAFSIDHLHDLFTVEKVEMKPTENVGATVFDKVGTSYAADEPAESLGASKMTDESLYLIKTAEFMRESEDAHVHSSSGKKIEISAEDLKSKAFSEMCPKRKD
jgi:hypothetical protein